MTFRTRALPLGLAIVTLVAFLPALRNGFVEWDDHILLVGNPAYRGLGWAQLRWMATSVLLGHYAPVTWLTWGLDYVLWGMNPFGYHLTNVVLHAANVVLWYWVARRLLARATTLEGPARELGAVTAALVFAVHPLRVETVAWVTERRGVLSGAFFLLTILTYLEAVDAAAPRRRRLLWVSVGAYLLALASKASTMTLPVVLILLDAYPLGRLPGDVRRWPAGAYRSVWVEKLPYLVLAAGAAVASYIAVSTGAFTVSIPPSPWLALALSGVWFYVYKTLAPIGLSPLYELPYEANVLEPWHLVGAAGVVGITVVMLVLRRRWPAGLAVWVYYGLMLAPVMGMTHAGLQLTADRYSYLACLGWALLAGAGVGLAARAVATGRLGRGVGVGLVAAGLTILVGLAGLTWHQAAIWHDTESLWRHASAVAPECASCHLNLGSLLQARGESEVALTEFARALALRPDRVLIHTNVGLALASLGRHQEAVLHYERVLSRYPDATPVRGNLAAALEALGRHQEAVAEVRRVLEHSSPTAALTYFRLAAAAKPERAILRVGLLEAHVALGELGLAREDYAALQVLSPALAREVAGSVPPQP